VTSVGLIDLAGDWTLTDVIVEWTCPMRVPGDRIKALHEAGLFADPCFVHNEIYLRRVADRCAI